MRLALTLHLSEPASVLGWPASPNSGAPIGYRGRKPLGCRAERCALLPKASHTMDMYEQDSPVAQIESSEFLLGTVKGETRS